MSYAGHKPECQVNATWEMDRECDCGGVEQVDAPQPAPAQAGQITVPREMLERWAGELCLAWGSASHAHYKTRVINEMRALLGAQPSTRRGEHG